MKNLTVKETEWLLDFVESSIVNECLGEDDGRYEEWEAMLEKLQSDKVLTDKEKEMLKQHLEEVADTCDLFSDEEKELMRTVAAKVAC